jgi:hypothetical protein
MQKLCLRTGELLSRHPILWLPYLGADLLAICLWRLRGLAQKSIVHWFATGHSALGGSIALPPHDYAALNRAFLAYLPIGIATILSIVWLFVAALLATATMVHSIELDQRPDAGKILTEVSAHWLRILLFALRFLITLVVFAGGTTALSSYVLFLLHRGDLFHTSFGLIAGLVLVGIGCTAWLVIPSALRLLKRDAAALVPAYIRNQGTILAILATEAGVAVGFVVPKLEASVLLDSQWEITALSVVNSVVANAPDALLFVALALLAAEVSRERNNEKNSKIVELLPVLMPLHFGKSEDPPQAN